MKVRKAVIPVAGLGTRFLPATKGIPKELFPLANKPVLLYLVEEAVQSGIEEIILVSHPEKAAIEKFFPTDKDGTKALIREAHCHRFVLYLPTFA